MMVMSSLYDGYEFRGCLLFKKFFLMPEIFQQEVQPSILHLDKRLSVTQPSRLKQI